MSDLSKNKLPATHCLILERDDSVLKIWLNRPEAKNALSMEMTDELNLVLDSVRDDRSIRTIVLRGSGGVFCAGGDIKGMGFERMKRFFASDANDLGATVKEIAINVCDWNQFVIADRSEFEKNADVPTAQSVFDEM